MILLNYYQLNKIRPILRTLPQPNIIPPTPPDYALGTYQRFFCKKNNENIYFEIDKPTHEKLTQKNQNIAFDLYSSIATLWYLKGKISKIYKSNKGLIELIENEKAVTALQNKYIYHEFYKKIEDLIIEEASFLSDFLYENTLLKNQNVNKYGYSYDRVYLFNDEIPHKVLERLKLKSQYHSYYAGRIKNRIKYDSLLIEYLKTDCHCL